MVEDLLWILVVKFGGTGRDKHTHTLPLLCSVEDCMVCYMNDSFRVDKR